MGRIDDIDDEIVLFVQKKLFGDPLLHGVVVEGIGAGEVNDGDLVLRAPLRITIGGLDLRDIHGHPRKIPHMEFRIGDGVDEGALPYIGLTHQGDFDLLFFHCFLNLCASIFYFDIQYHLIDDIILSLS